MKVSIIIITKNEEKFLPKLLKSIKEQKVNFDYEIIVSDAFSQDKTRQIAKDFNCKIVDGGLPAKGRNEGAKFAKGKYLLFLDADSLLEKDSLQYWIDKMEKTKSSIGTPYVKLREDEKGFLVNLYFKTSLLSYNLFNAVFGCCIIVEKTIFEKVNGFNEKSYLGEDIELIFKLKKIGKRKNLFPYVQTSGRRVVKMGVFKTILLSSYLGVKLLFGKITSKTSKTEKIYKL